MTAITPDQLADILEAGAKSLRRHEGNTDPETNIRWALEAMAAASRHIAVQERRQAADELTRLGQELGT